MPEINNIFIDDPKRLCEPIKAIEVSTNIEIKSNYCEIVKYGTLIKAALHFEFSIELNLDLQFERKMFFVSFFKLGQMEVSAGFLASQGSCQTTHRLF